jgi:AraC-like DNA-binding protein
MSSAAAPGPQKFEWLLTAETQPDAYDRYRASLANTYQVTGVSDHDIAHFRNLAVGMHLGAAVIVRCWSVAQTFVRTPREVKRSGHDHINIILDISGQVTADYDGRAVNSRGGCVRFMDLGREVNTRMAAFEMINLVVPRTRIPERFLALDLHGLTLDPDLGATRLLARHLTDLFDHGDSMTAGEAKSALEAGFMLIDGALGASPEMTPDQIHAVQRTVRSAAKAFVDANLTLDRLDPAKIAAAVGVSRSVLYRAFDSYGGVAAYVMTRRLDRCFEALLTRRGRTPPISQIAYAHGFTSDAHFSRAFKTRFGMSPREVEDRPGGPDAADLRFEGPAAPAALTWFNTL